MVKLKTGNVALCIVGSAILSFGLYNIHSLSGVTEGGILGATLLLQHWLHLSPALTGLIMNAICYYIGWRLLGWELILYSAIAGSGFSFFYSIFEQFPPIYPPLANLPFVAAILGAFFVGIGVGLCIRAGGAPSGDDALALGICKYSGVRIWVVYLLGDLLVLLLSLSYLSWKQLLFSLMTVMLSSRIVDFVQNFAFHKKAKASG